MGCHILTMIAFPEIRIPFMDWITDLSPGSSAAHNYAGNGTHRTSKSSGDSCSIHPCAIDFPDCIPES